MSNTNDDSINYSPHRIESSAIREAAQPTLLELIAFELIYGSPPTQTILDLYAECEHDDSTGSDIWGEPKANANIIRAKLEAAVPAKRVPDGDGARTTVHIKAIGWNECRKEFLGGGE